MRLTKLDNGQYRMKINCKLGKFEYIGSVEACWNFVLTAEGFYKNGL